MEGNGFVQTSSPLSSYTCLPAGKVVGKRRGGREEGAERERGEKRKGEKRGRGEGEGEKEEALNQQAVHDYKTHTPWWATHPQYPSTP